MNRKVFEVKESIVNNKNNIFSLESICKLTFLIFLCVIYAFYYEYRLYAEIIYIIFFSIYFLFNKGFFTKYTLWNLLFIVVCIVSISYSFIPSISMEMTRKMIELAILTNLLIVFINSKEKVLFIQQAFVIAGLVLSLRFIITYPISTWGDTRMGDDLMRSEERRVGKGCRSGRWRHA